MLRRRLTSDCQPRTKNGQPAHSTTGVLRTNCIQRDGSPSTQVGAFGNRCAIATTNTGSVRARADPEPPSHVAQLGVLIFAAGDGGSSAPASSRRLGNCPDDPARSAGASGRCRWSCRGFAESRVALQRHAALRTTTRRVALHAFAHRTKVFLRWLTSRGIFSIDFHSGDGIAHS